MQSFEDGWVVSAGDLVDVVECGHRVGLSHALAAGLDDRGPDGAARDQPAAGPSAPDQPAPGEEAGGQPAAGQPAAGQPAAGQPAAGRRVTVSAPDATAVRHGEAHERRILDHLRGLFGTEGVVVIERPGNTRAALIQAAARTRDALAAGVPVVYQGVLFDGAFHGRPDFLIAAHLDPGTGQATGPAIPQRYEPFDAKLARHARPGAVLQLASYAAALPAAGVELPRFMHLVHPAERRTRDPGGSLVRPEGSVSPRSMADGVIRTFRVDDILPMVSHARARLTARLADAPAMPTPSWSEPRPACATCAFSTHCDRGRRDARDLSLVAGLRSDQRRVLRAAGIASVEELAAAGDDQRPATMSDAAFAGLRLQADLQARQDATRTADDPTGTITVRVVAPDGLAALPVPDPGDVYFDMEGDPYALDNAGLEYLFGAVTLAGPQEQYPQEQEEVFHAFWAHDRPGEKRAFERFIDWAVERLDRHPDAHIYHYAPYEPNALRRLAARHGTRERQVDDLLARGRLVDLYSVVRRSLRISQPSYSIKYLEPLFLPGARGAGVANAADSIVAYEGFLAHRAAGEDPAAERLLDQIAEYNRVDCVSTHRLHRWLLDLQQSHAVVPRGGSDPAGLVDPASPASAAGQIGLDEADEADEPDALVRALTAGLPDDPAAASPDERARGLLAAAVGYHRRENRPAWWSYFAALTADRATLEEADDCAVPLSWTIVEDWAEPTGRQRRSRRQLHARTDPDNPHPFDRGEAVRLLYPGSSGTDAVTTDAVVEQAEPHALLLRESAPPQTLAHGHPLAVLPGPPVRPEPKPAAIRDLAARTALARTALARTALARPDLPSSAALDLLRRRPPRLRDGSSGLPAPAAHGGDQIAAVLAAVTALEGSYLAVQGPPGAGKTYLAGRLIRHLVAEGRSVGICSTSHKAIENAMLAATGEGPAIPAAKKPRSGRKPDPQAHLPWDTPRDLRALVAWRAEHPAGHLVGDTAWAFANPALRSAPFDVLIIDEAGQFALADTIAVAGAARSLVLLGDPQQLPQVVAGIHPDGADASALSHLLRGAEVIPPEFGYFLDRTRRMHPEVCAPVSALAYQGRLHAHPVAAERGVAGVPPGLYRHDVAHTGNGTRSDEEVDAVRGLVRHLLGRTFVDGDTARPLTGRDILVVAPYNRQVRAVEHALGKAGLTGVRVGTVDRFQGQEAPVVITSLTTSSAAQAPRGLDFLLSRNRLNVAISRAQVVSVLVMSPALLDSSPGSVDELRLLAGLARLRAMARTDLHPDSPA